MLCLAQGSVGACILNDYINFDAYVVSALLTVALIGTMYVAGRIAQRRGRSFRNWASIAGIGLGPLAIALLLLLPNLHGKNGDPA
jgi:MFS family permease